MVCKICIALHGLSGEELFNNNCSYAFKTEEELFNHLEKVHHYKIIDREVKK